MSNPFSDNYHQFKNGDGYTLDIFPASSPDKFVISVPTAPGHRMLIPVEDAPAVALAILRAAGFVPGGNRRDADSFQESVDTAAGYLDDAVLIAAGAAAAKELTKRRDELARELFDQPAYSLHPGPFTYTGSPEVVRAAIDMIIQLQDEATK